MEGGRSDTGMMVVTDTEKTEPLLTVVLIRSPASGLKYKVSQLFLSRLVSDCVLLVAGRAGSQDSWMDGRGNTRSTSQLSSSSSPSTE